MASDEQIAADLADRGTISAAELDVWRHMEGFDKAEGFELNRKYLVSTRTLQRWAKKVRAAIAERRAEIQSGKVRFGVTIADGSSARFASDPTAARRPPRSSWDAERLRTACKKR